LAKKRVDPPPPRPDLDRDLGRRCPLPGTPDGQKGRPPSQGGDDPSWRSSARGEANMAGYGLFVLILAVGAATAGYFWLRND
jgi:hypothetical protein